MKNIILITLITSCVILGVFFGANQVAKKACLKSYDSFQPEYTLWTNCRIVVNGVLTPVDIVRELN